MTLESLALRALLLAATCGAVPALAAESEAMQRERALNRILVAEREAREREAAARGNGLMGIKPAPAAAGAGATKPKKTPSRQRGQERPPRS